MAVQRRPARSPPFRRVLAWSSRPAKADPLRPFQHPTSGRRFDAPDNVCGHRVSRSWLSGIRAPRAAVGRAMRSYTQYYRPVKKNTKGPRCRAAPKTAFHPHRRRLPPLPQTRLDDGTPRPTQFVSAQAGTRCEKQRLARLRRAARTGSRSSKIIIANEERGGFLGAARPRQT